MSSHLVMVRTTRRVRDLFRKRYWVDCVHCEMRTGPHTAALAAMEAAAECPHTAPEEYLCLAHGPTYHVDFREVGSGHYEPFCMACGQPMTPIYGEKEEDAWKA